MDKILFLTYYFPPIGGAPAQRSIKFIKYLPANGYLPIVITGPGSFHSEWTPEDLSLLKEISTGIPIYRTNDPPPITDGKMSQRFKRWMGLRSTFTKWWINSAIITTEQAYQKENGIKLIFATMSPFDSASVAAHLSEKFGIPWVADLRDAWALDEIQVYPSYIHKKLEMIKMHNVLSTAAAIVMNTPEATETLKRTFSGLKSKKIVTITNGFDPEDFSQQITPRTDGKFRIVHSGSFLTDLGLISKRRKYLYHILGSAQGGVDIATRSPLTLLAAVKQWSERNPRIVNSIEMVFVGNVSKKDQILSEYAVSQEMCRFTGYLSREESIGITRTADLLFLPMHNLPPGRRSTSVPSKIYEYMASGRPILGAVPDGDAKDFLTESGAGFICRPDDIQGMIHILDEVYALWKKKKQTIKINADFVSKFERKNLAEILAKEFNCVLNK